MTAPLPIPPVTESATAAPRTPEQQTRPVTKAAFAAYQEQLFKALQPPLARLMQGSLAADLPAVLFAVRRFTASSESYPLERQLADYILFPLFHHLRSEDMRNLPQAAQENVLELLWFVWQRIPWVPTLLQAELGSNTPDMPLVNDSAAMNSLMIVAKSALPQAPEDIAHRSIAVLLMILGHPSVPDPFNPPASLAKDQLLTEVNTRPDRVLAVPKSAQFTSLYKLFSARIGNLLYFQLVTNLFDLLASSKLLRLRQLALVAVHDMLLVVARDPNVAGLVLPSVMSKCTLLVCEPNPNSSLVALALDVMSRLIPFALQQSDAAHSKSDPSVDVAYADSGEPKDALAAWYEFASKSGLLPPASASTCSPDIPTRSFPLSAAVEFSRDSSWFTTTAANVTATLNAIYKTLVPSTASPEVLVSACNLARTLTTDCSAHLAAALPHLFKFAAACTLSEFTQIQSAAATMIDAVFSLPVQLQDIPARALSDALNGLTSLASISDEDKVTRLRQLQGCLVAIKSVRASMSSTTTSELHTTFIATMDKTIRAWQSLLVVDSETPLRSETDARFRRWNFVAFHQLPVADAAWDAIGAWASAGGDTVVQSILSQLVESVNRDMHHDESKHNTRRPAFMTKLSEDPMTDLRNQLLAARFAAHTDKPDQAQQQAAQRTDRRRALYALFAATFAANPTSAWLMQHVTSVLEDPPVDPLPAALVLTGLEQTVLPSYTEFVRTHLAQILVHSTSTSLPLQVAAQAYIDRALVPRLKCTSLPDLLDKYSPYLMHQVHLGLMYPHLEPGLPKMLLAVARAKAQAASVTGGWLQELVKPVMDALAQNAQCEEMWREFTLALIEIVRQVCVDPLPEDTRDNKGVVGDDVKVDARASEWIQKAFGPAAVSAARAAKEKAEGIPQWERKRQPGERLPHEKDQPGDDNDQDQMHPFDASNDAADDDADISTLPGPVQSLLAILYHARNLIQSAPPRTRVELVRLATAVMPKLDTYVRYTRHPVYRIHQVMTLDPAKWVGTGAELAYVSEAACEFLAAAARHSPEYAAQKAVDHFGPVIVQLVKRGVPAAVDLVVAVVEAEAEGMESGGWGGVVTSRWARDVVEAAVPRFVAPWAPALRRYGREDVRPKLEFALQGLARSVRVGDVVWAALAAARAALGTSAEQAHGSNGAGRVQEWCTGVALSQVKRWKSLLSSSVDSAQVAKLDVILSSS